MGKHSQIHNGSKMIKEEERRHLVPFVDEVMESLESVLANYEVAYAAKIKECTELRQRVGSLMGEVALLTKECNGLRKRIMEQESKES